MRIAIIGCGLIGNKRAKALGEHTLVACADAKPERADALAKLHPGCSAYEDWRKAAAHPDVDAVIVSTTNDMLVPATLAAIAQDRPILALGVEKMWTGDRAGTIAGMK